MANKSSQIELNDSQKTYILTNWDREGMDLNELTKKCFGDELLNGHSAQAMALKSFLVSSVGKETMAAKLKTTKFVKGEDIVLTPEQITFIEANYKVMKVAEMTNLLFNKENKKKLTPLNKEYRVVYSHVQSLDATFIPKDEQMDSDEEYKPPVSIARLVPRVNKYVLKDMEGGKKFLDAENLKPLEAKNLGALLSHMNVYRFIYQASQFKKTVDREVYESSYIRFLWDKPDALPEEVDSYIDLCAETVNIAQIDRTIQQLDFQLEAMLEGDNDSKRLSMTFVETLNSMREKSNAAKTRKEKLMNSLVGARAKRMENKVQQNASILNLVEAWKNEEKRKELLELAEMEKLADELEVDKLSSLDAVVGLIAGITKGEVR